VDPGEILKSDSRGIYTIQTDEVLEIIYTGKEWENSPYQDSPFQVSRIKLNESLTVAENGYVYNSASFVVYGFPG
jgi:hypothetical protein